MTQAAKEIIESITREVDKEFSGETLSERRQIIIMILLAEIAAGKLFGEFSAAD